MLLEAFSAEMSEAAIGWHRQVGSYTIPSGAAFGECSVIALA